MLEGGDSCISDLGVTPCLLTWRSALPLRHPSAGPSGPPCLHCGGLNGCKQPRAQQHLGRWPHPSPDSLKVASLGALGGGSWASEHDGCCSHRGVKREVCLARHLGRCMLRACRESVGIVGIVVSGGTACNTAGGLSGSRILWEFE